MSSRSLFGAFAFVLVACGGATSTAESSGPTPGPAATPEPAPPSTIHAGSTLRFDPHTVVAKRMPVHAGCGERNAPFNDDDLFSLQAVGVRSDNPLVHSVVVNFHRTVTVGTPVELIIGGPTGGMTLGDGQLQASPPDDRTGASVDVHHPGFTEGTPPVDTLAQAKVTVLAVATQDGEPLTARVEVHFEGGDVLDATFSSALESYAGPCGG